MKKQNKPFWELGLNPVIMDKFESLDRIRSREDKTDDAKDKLLQ